MNAARAILLTALVLAGTGVAAVNQANAQPADVVGTLQGQSLAVGPRQTPQRPTPLFTLGWLSLGIWAPVQAPYDPNSNRNLAASSPW
jgi:hypothetical protein